MIHKSLVDRLSLNKIASPFLIAPLLTLCTAHVSNAELLVYDGFGVGVGGYTDGASITGNGHGTGWLGDWTAGSQYATVSGGIAPSSIVSEDGMVTFGDGSSSQAMGRSYDVTFSSDDITEGWASWTVQRNGLREFRLNPFATVTTGAGQFMGIHAENFSSSLTANIRYGSANDIATGTSFEMSTATSYFMIAQAILNPLGTPDTFNVWIFESSSYTGASLGAPTISVSHDSDFDFDSWSVTDQNPQNNTANVVYDEFRIGNTFEDVSGIVPEPSTYALLAGAVCVGIAYLRRRHH
ncbi:PEP-CTERM sorting domain-containing protein [Cerasicoccus frondis]|uniref:PEP-CTERM sorting domain-containing protein n=1 Tax=Cerasicoccus frondis TaxID=490090 RepID=UPI002852C8C5|nr:PEP-CTERM sorting domain-containing protein [Cerasicoccus frondis]